MGQKVNPHGFRVEVIKNWDSKWYAEYNEDISSGANVSRINDARDRNHWLTAKAKNKMRSFDFSKIRQFARMLMQNIMMRRMLPRYKLLE